MDRFDAMRVFVMVAEQRSFARAARKLAMSAAATTRAISALEQQLGARLLHRTTRQVRTTDAGTRFLLDAKRILTELGEAEANVRGAQSEPRGLVAVTAPLMFGRMHVAPIVLQLLAQHPELSVRALFVDHVVDLLEESVDVAVRIGALADSSLSAIRVGVLRRVVCAAPAYLAQHGTPQIPKDLAFHQLIGFVGIHPHRHWSFGPASNSEQLVPHPRLIVNTADVAIEAALAGRGLTRVLSYQVERELEDGRLVRVLEKHEPPPIPLHVVHGYGKSAPARVRAFLELAVPRLRALALR